MSLILIQIITSVLIFNLKIMNLLIFQLFNFLISIQYEIWMRRIHRKDTIVMKSDSQ